MMFSPTQRALDNLIFRPTKLTQNKRKRIPAASEVKSYDHASVLLRAKWDRTRMRRVHGN
ncbi:NinE family protein [Tatumella citrea]|uniref:NinE family protein n=1 Tax=Tatumella citrea TaxID=53336 RepID=UPI000B3D3F63|nr:NinE family protein [Tatumella citrea]